MLCLVTGANGHLGNTLVRELLKQGHTVRAGVRDINNR
ncbi:NmrA family NAD(P)-binding protein, partial [Streptococcus danieliae]|nr:NmrA family NAD(P)-binding protein [Streptococcus danieliae]